MKKSVVVSAALLSLCLSAAAAINSASEEVLKMVNSGVSQDVVQQYINSSPAAFNLNADEILYLQQNGVPQPVISTMLSHDNGIAQGTTQQYSSPAEQNPPYQQSQDYQQSQTYQTDQTVQQQVNPPDVYANQNQQVMQVAPDQAPPQVASFYDELRPYGNWIYLEGYGWCWQPNEVRTQATWQPYCDNGSWLYCNDGWYWQSYYNWGWAPFHYGRWWHANCGWVWFPDTVWAPSWVCWRNTGDYCGWAPLPPSGFRGYGRPGFHFGVNFEIGSIGAGLFTFIHLGDIFHGGHGHGYRNYEVPRSQYTRIYNNSRVINNVTVVNNNYARNPGISRQVVERVAGPVRVAPVRTTTQDPQVARPGVVNNGSQVAIVRPERAPTPSRTTPVVGHRLPANARTVPATTPNVRQTRNATPNGREQNVNPGTTTYNQPLQSPRSTDYSRRNTSRTTEAPRTSTTPEAPRTANPRVTETPSTTNPHVTEAPWTTNRRITETPQTTNPRVNEVPRTSNPQVREVPRTTNPHASEVPRPTENSHVTQTPHSTPQRTEVPNPTPHVSEVPHPAPHVTEVPHATPPARTPSPAQSEVHRAYPQTEPRVQAPPVHEPAGARPAPAPVPHAAPPPPRETHHVEAPPAARPSSAPGIERHSSPPPGLSQPHGDGRRDHNF